MPSPEGKDVAVDVWYACNQLEVLLLLLMLLLVHAWKRAGHCRQKRALEVSSSGCIADLKSPGDVWVIAPNY
jgi:hypothetical protein